MARERFRKRRVATAATVRLCPFCHRESARQSLTCPFCNTALPHDLSGDFTRQDTLRRVPQRPRLVAAYGDDL